MKRKSLDSENCIFCEKGHGHEKLSSVQSFEQDSNIRTMATELQGAEILTRVSGGDMIATEAKYHLSCLNKLRNRYRSFLRKQKQQPENDDDRVNESRAFEELLAFIEESVISGVFRV
ncbi:hypothetical protein ElyMa_001536100 [Elysia marginata]|uniref:Uncharacterized protein n=1 Tax=Elysia marginata TaxID=1093978 RepID=A0AAV4J882_9GAST|nr:hypothetical protein ElyMa_001536100 [Elysia marginata]